MLLNFVGIYAQAHGDVAVFKQFRAVARLKIRHGGNVANSDAFVNHGRAHIQAALNAEADLLYLGGELINNRYLLHELGSLNVPVVVCKDIHHTVRDWLIAAEQIALRGNQHILLGEAGTLSLHSAPARLDVEAIAQAKQQSHLPVLANISTLAHRHMPVATLRRLAIAAGADVIIE